MFGQPKRSTNEHTFDTKPRTRGIPFKERRLDFYLSAKRFFGFPEASILPTWFLWFRFIVLPDAWLPMDNPIAKIAYDTDTIFLFGVPYSFELFRQFAHTLPIGKPFKIIRRTENGVVILELIPDAHHANSSATSESN